MDYINNNFQNNYGRQMPVINNNQSMYQNKPLSNIDWIMVQNVSQIEQIAVMPGQKAWVMVQNEPVFALRSADNMGLVNTEMYKFEKYTREVDESTNNFVTKDEMDKAIKEAIKEIRNESIISANE